MQILQLCKKFPYPLKDGESIAITYLSKAMASKGCKVTLLAMNTSKHFTNVNDLPDDYDHYHAIHQVSVDNTIKPLQAFANLFSNESYHVTRFISDDFKSKLIALLKKNSFDVVQLETLYLTPYIDVIRQHSDAIITMRSHNIEFEIWERITKNTSSLVKRWYLNHLTKKLKNFEIQRLNDYDYLIAVSDRDLQKFKQLGYKNGAMASPIGLEINNYIQLPAASQNDLCFIGALDWIPNKEGYDWFVRKAWPLIQKSMPHLKLHVAGRNTPTELKAAAPTNVKIHGEVQDAIQFINKYDIMIVPLFSGSGMRVKILEGMALGKTIITTTLGKEGINAEHNIHLLVADTAEQFVEAISKAVNDDQLRAKLGGNAQAFVKKYYDHAAIAQTLIEKYQQLMREPHH